MTKKVQKAPVKTKGTKAPAAKKKGVERRSKIKETAIDPLAYEKWHREAHSPETHAAWIAGGKVINPDDLEEAPVQISEKERTRRELEKTNLLEKLKREREQANAKEIINGQKVDYLDETGSDGKTWRVYGKGPHFKGGRLIRYSDGRWSSSFDFQRIGIEIPTHTITSQLKDESRREIYYRMSQIEGLVHFLVSPDDIKKSSEEWKERKQFIEEALNASEPSAIEYIAKALMGMWASRQRRTENERVIHSILNMARKLNAVPL